MREWIVWWKAEVRRSREQGVEIKFVGSSGFLDVGERETAKNAGVGKGWVLGEDGVVG